MQVPRARTNPVDGVPDLKLKEIRLVAGLGCQGIAPPNIV